MFAGKNKVLGFSSSTLVSVADSGVQRYASVPGRWSHRSAASVLEKLLDDRRVSQRGDVAEVSFIGGDFAEDSSHDLTCRHNGTEHTGPILQTVPLKISTDTFTVTCHSIKNQ